MTSNVKEPVAFSDKCVAALLRPWAAFFIVGLIALVLFTAFNRFPTFYYTDERVKVDFVRGRQDNLNHPLLLMGTSWVAAHLFHAKSKESMIWTGRAVSAIFAVIAVLALMGTAWKLHGRAAGWAVGFMLATSPALLARAHFMKEDTALVMGMALTCLAIAHYHSRPTLRNLVLLAAAAATAASGKYIGIVMLPISLGFLLKSLRENPRSQMRSFVVFAGTFLFVIGLINIYYVFHPGQFIAGLLFEARHVTSGHHGLTTTSPLTDAAMLYAIETPWPAIALAGVDVIIFFARFRRRSAPEWLMALVPLVFFAMISTSHIQSARYLLPVAVWTHYLAGVGLIECIQFVHAANVRRLLQPVAIAAVVLVQLWVCAIELDHFNKDSRQQLARWAQENLPREARVVEDRDVRLGSKSEWKDRRIKIRFAVNSPKSAADAGNLNDLRAKGITHVAVCSLDYGRFFAENVTPTDGNEQEFQRRRAFYVQLFGEGELLWQSTPHDRPIVYLFRISPPLSSLKFNPTPMGLDPVDQFEQVP